ncbi:bifunctional 4-hydroxy-2-oxoglutarate aldolase/2-dehydro-3-deoxy-phosphogluconate aldolase [Arthrobacter sp. MW3 TE3886]|jgi:2-dehydro-3-deoxyphosphogluconate aldolase/(4S)-4-hydroxy-2-oxoglutarate aldolase|uniref:bifunctional 4-hydroxy-2-oxoglutarate aldolase/2-dehydro-3-deoxy-phosphogluconate aldolase n=1 Tax=Arthrobacter sp. MW3 TE3886 TaxID=3156254 RepID=UPI0035185829
MLTKFEVLETIVRTGALLIARLDSADEAYRVAEAAIDGGIRAVEVPLTVPGALGVIERLADKYGDQGIVVGAGTVLDAEAAYASVSAGARLLVSPQLNPNMIAAANRYQAVTASGAFTPTEVLNTLEAGADIVKLFPAELGGPAYVKTILAPLPQAPIMPSGGVTPENVGAWFAAGVTAVGVGSFVTKAAQNDGDYGLVARAARTFLEAIDNARP